MKFRLSTLLVSASLLLIACVESTGQVSASARKTDEELSAMDWKEIVDYYLHAMDESNDPESKAYVDRLRTLLAHDGLMHIQTYRAANGNKDVGKQIYYRPGELHVVGAFRGIDAEPGDWNLLVRNGKAYEWRTGGSTGIVSKAVDKDMIDYLIYLTDVSLIHTTMYRECLRNPESDIPARIDESNGWTEYRIKKGNKLGIAAVFVGYDPLWIYGIEIEQDGLPFRLIQDRPVQIECEPKNLFAPLDWIRFEERDTSLRRHLIFL